MFLSVNISLPRTNATAFDEENVSTFFIIQSKEWFL